MGRGTIRVQAYGRISPGKMHCMNMQAGARRREEVLGRCCVISCGLGSEGC